MKKEIIILLKTLNTKFNDSLINGDVVCYVDKIFESATILPIFRDATLVGFIAYYDNREDEKTAFLSMLAVSEEFWGQGLGNKLVQESIDRLIKKGFERYQLDVLKGNERALGLYETLGFEIIENKGDMFKMEKYLKK